jgi:RNA polymerase sigma factor (sigma-70 family)
MKEKIEQFYKDEYDNLVRRMRGRCGSVEDAEDVVMEAFTRALKYKNTYNPNKQEIGGWFNMILLNAYHNYASDKHRRGMSVEVSDKFIEGYEGNQMESTLADQLAEEIDLIEDVDKRDVLVAFFIDGYTPKEISQFLKANVRQVNNITQIFMGKLKEKHGLV